jgi:hypothetical protein
MKSRSPQYLSAGLILLGSLLGVLSIQAQQKNPVASTIRVTLHYTGSGTVDASHKIFVALWDSPAFLQGSAMPVAVESTTSKNGTVTFSDVKVNPAYASSAYDPTGKWDGQSGPPPSGSALGMYSKSPKTPEPISIAAGKTARVTIQFDDSVKVP